MTDSITAKWIRNRSDELAVANGCFFDEAAGQHVIDFAAKYLRLYEGELAGEPLVPGDWQIEATMRLFGWKKHSERWKRPVRRFRRAGVWIPKKNGKALALDTPIPTPYGWTTIGEMRPGDQVFTERGTLCTVLETHPVIEDDDTYEVSFSNGEKVVCNGQHLWETVALQETVGLGSRNKRFKGNKWTGSYNCRFEPRAVRTTEQISATLRRRDKAANHSVDVAVPLQCSEKELPMDPYVLGCWLGDGDSDAARITATPSDCDTYWSEFVKAGYSVRCHADNSSGARRFVFKDNWSVNPDRTTLKRMGLFRNKHIPAIYLRASAKQRLSLLQGLMDTDGCASKDGKCLTYTTKLAALAAGVSELLSSLGIKHGLKTRTPVIAGKRREYHTLQFHVYRDRLPVFRLPRKLKRMRETGDLIIRGRCSTIQIIDVQKVKSRPVRCISVDNPTGLFLCGRTMIPTHNSPTLAWWALYLLCADGEKGQKVYLCAKDGQQAREIAGKHAIEMAQASSSLMRKFSINKTLMQINHEPSRSLLKPISSSDSKAQKAKEGLNGSCLIDETHVVDREFVNRISRAGISRSEPFQIEVSTAGNDPESYGKEQFDYGRKVESGDIVDESYFFLAYAAPQDLTDEELAADPVKYGRMANPTWGRIVGEAEYLDDYNRSKRSIIELADFKMYRLNVWQSAANPWLRMGYWKANQREYSEAELYGRPCYAGLDLAKTRDTTALSLCFPEDDGTYKLLVYYWLPQVRADELSRDVGYLQWAKENWVSLTPGNTCDYGYIRTQINEIRQRYNLEKIAFDGTYAAQLMQRLVEEDGLADAVLEKFPQSMMGFTGAMTTMERLVFDGKLHHNGNPVLTWQAGNTCAYRDANDNIRPMKDKKGSIRTIDGVVASIMALGMAVTYAGTISTGGVEAW